MLRRAWLAASIAWCAFWAWAYLVRLPLTSRDQFLNVSVQTTLILALPWLFGWLLRWIVTGRWKA